MRVIIAGSRGIQDYGLLERVIINSGFHITTVISGGAKGVDRLGELWANREGIPVEQYLADWRLQGKKAGMLRNKTMVSTGEGLVAIWDGESPGTLDTIRRVKDAGLKFCIYNTKTERYIKG